MKSRDAIPPRWAEATLQSLLRPSDRESISGDLLEEYRAVRRPTLGSMRADLWYLKHLLSVLWRLMWPCALALIALILAGAKIKLLWYGSLVQAPLVSLAQGVTYACAGYFVSRRTGLMRTGTIVACAAGVIGYTVQFTAFAVVDPRLVAAPFEKPFIFVILAVYLLTALAYAAVAGSIGGALGRWWPRGSVERAPVS
jgi:hypothetical protein